MTLPSSIALFENPENVEINFLLWVDKLPIEEFAETFDTNGAVVVWPPEGIKTFDPLDIPFLNTLILLMSGTTCTWAHHAVREGHRDQAIQALWLTVGLGVAFTLLPVSYTHLTLPTILLV